MLVTAPPPATRGNAAPQPASLNAVSETDPAESVLPGRAAAESKSADTKAAVFEFWQTSDAYRDFGPEKLAESPHRRRLKELLASCRTVLDLACGDGNNLPHLPAGTDYIGVDCSPVGLRRLMGRDDHPALSKRSVVADVERLPFAEGSVDAVLSTFAFEHFLSVPRILAECDRVLRPGGRLVLIGPDFSFPNSFGPPQRETLLNQREPLLCYAAARLGRRVKDRLLGRYGFEYITPQPLSDATYVPDADMTHLTDHGEIARYMHPMGYRLVAREAGVAPQGVKRWTSALGLWGHHGDALLCLSKTAARTSVPRVREQTIA